MTNWTIEGVQHQKNKNWWIRQQWPYLMNSKYQQRRENYLILFPMRYPVYYWLKPRKVKKKMKQDKLRFFCRKISWNRYCKNKKIIRKLFLHSLFYSPFVGWLVMKKPYHWRFLAYFGDFLLDCSAQPWHRWCMIHLDQSSALHDIGLSYIG